MKEKIGAGNKLQNYDEKTGQYAKTSNYNEYMDTNGAYQFPSYYIHEEEYADFYLNNVAEIKNKVIRQEKLTKYLLVPREKNDKSKLLFMLGYSLSDYKKLYDDIINNTFFQRRRLSTFYQETYTFTCGTILFNQKTERPFFCETVWQLDNASSVHFVTIIFGRTSDE